MASWLVLDWDQDHFHVLCAQSARHGVRVTQAASWAHPEPFTPSTAERVGKALRDFLKSAGIAGAPVIFGLGRDRIFLKELRFPEIAPHEEAGLVRFQTGKELTESVENYSVDYVHLKQEAGGERRVMTVAARRDIVMMIQTLCQAAGLKLHAVTPKLFGTAQSVERALQPEPTPLKPDALNAALTVGQRWAELCFFRGRRILQVQALANGPMLVNEIKRNLAVFQAQHAVDVDVTGPDCLYVFGDNQAGVQSAENGHHLPIRMLDPLKAEPNVAKEMKNPACFAGAVGLAELWSSGAKPINLTAPRRQAAPVSMSKKRSILYGAAAAVFAVLAVGGMYYLLSHQQKQIRDLTLLRIQQEKFLTDNAQERADLDAYKDWEQTTIPWLDEIYDLSARYPWEVGFRVNQFSAGATPVKKKDAKDEKKDGKDNFVGIGKIALQGYAPSGKDRLVYELIGTLSRDPHVRSYPGQITPHGAAPIDYRMTIDVAKQSIKKYDTRLIVPPPPPKAFRPAVKAVPKAADLAAAEGGVP